MYDNSPVVRAACSAEQLNNPNISDSVRGDGSHCSNRNVYQYFLPLKRFLLHNQKQICGNNNGSGNSYFACVNNNAWGLQLADVAAKYINFFVVIKLVNSDHIKSNFQWSFQWALYANKNLCHVVRRTVMPCTFPFYVPYPGFVFC